MAMMTLDASARQAVQAAFHAKRTEQKVALATVRAAEQQEEQTGQAQLNCSHH